MATRAKEFWSKNRVLIVVLGVVGALAVGGVAIVGWLALSFWDFPVAARALPDTMAQYRALGLPWVAADLAPKPPVAPEDNAAPHLVALTASLEARDWEIRQLRDAVRQGKPDVEARIVAFETELALARRATSYPRVDFRRDWDLGASLQFPELKGIRRAAQILGYHVEWSATMGRFDQAADDLRVLRRLGVFAGADPVLLGLLVNIKIDGIACEAAERALASAEGDLSALRRLRESVADGPLVDFRYPLKGEMYQGVATARNQHLFPRSEQDGEDAKPIDPAALLRAGVPASEYQQAYLQRHLALWVEAQRAIGRGRADPRKDADTLDSIGSRLEGERGMSHALNAIMFPLFGQAGRAVVHHEARLACVDALAGALEYRAQHGEWPASLPGAPLDLFDGKPLRYLITRAGIRIYSIGRDEVDDKGRTRLERPGKQTGTFDLVAAYPPVNQN